MRRRKALIGVLLLLLVYAGSYLALSRRGFASADRFGLRGLYFFEPRDSNAWRLANYGCVCAYYPLIKVDEWLGTGRPIGREPLWGLSK